MSVHDGHRERVVQRFIESGLDGFSDIQVLELILFYCIPRRDTNPIAHGLLDRMGSLSAVLEAPAEELCKVRGIGPGSATLLRLVTEAARFYQVDRAKQSNVLMTVEACAEYLIPHFFGRTDELVILLCLDAKCKPISVRRIAEGDVNSVSISIRKVVENALLSKASSVVLAHNHPGGLAVPSTEDVETTRAIASALRAADVELVDHFIIVDKEYTSMMNSGYLTDKKDRFRGV